MRLQSYLVLIIVCFGQTVSALGQFEGGLVVTDNEICSRIGNDILAQGGNAVDAAIAATFCTGVVDSRSSGLGGGHFAVIYSKKSRSCATIDAREEAPGAAYETMYREHVNGSLRGWLAVGIPGELHGLWTAYVNYGGKLPWRTLLEPSINLCKNGFVVSNDLAYAMKVKTENPANLPIVDYLINPLTGTSYRAGEYMVMPALGDTLTQLALAKNPAEMFYCGNISDVIVKEFAENDGIISKTDLCSYRVKYQAHSRKTIYTSLRNDNTVCAPPPPSSASVTAAILNIMDGYNFNATDVNDTEYLIKFYHKYIEASRFAYAVRSGFGDPDFVPEAMQEAQKITSPNFGGYVRNRILATSQNVDYYGADSFVKSDRGTAHISTVDAEGNSVSLTSTINFYFGAGVRSKATGIIWNNEMDDFSTPGSVNYFGYAPSPANFIKPGKRPVSSMSPLIVFDKSTGDPRLVIGGSGGSRIISIVAQVALRTLVLGQPLPEAIAAPRFHNQLIPDETYYEPEHPKEIIEALDKLGHKMTKKKDQFSPISTSVVAISKPKFGRIIGSNDPRRQKAHKKR